MVLFLVFLFGLIIGSFLNAVLYRLEVGGSLVTERSRCPKCGHILQWYELFPLLSFFIQKGKCRACKKRISIQYPLVELATGLLFLEVFLYYKEQFSVSLLYGFFVIALLVLVFVFDLKHYIIPNIAVYSLIILSFFYDLYFYDIADLKNFMIAAVAASGFFLFLYIVSSGRWIGFGDVKYGVFMGLFLGWPSVLVGLFLAYVSGAIIGLLLLAVKRKNFKSEIPFGPFLIIGTLIAFFWGKEILFWYLGFQV